MRSIQKYNPGPYQNDDGHWGREEWAKHIRFPAASLHAKLR